MFPVGRRSRAGARKAGARVRVTELLGVRSWGCGVLSDRGHQKELRELGPRVGKSEARAPGCFRFSRGGVGGEEVESCLGRGERGDQAEEALLPRGRGAGGLAFAGGSGTVGTMGPGPRVRWGREGRGL